MKVTFYITIEGEGSIRAFLSNSAGDKLLKIKKADIKVLDLEAGEYEFEWHVQQDGRVKYAFLIQSEDGKIDIAFKKAYITRREDGSFFKITI